MSKPFFKAEDFFLTETPPNSEAREYILRMVDKANVLLEQRGRRVYGQSHSRSYWSSLQVKDYNADTHQALLICIEELPGKACEHEPNTGELVRGPLPEISCKCKHCGVKLAARWEIAE